MIDYEPKRAALNTDDRIAALEARAEALEAAVRDVIEVVAALTLHPYEQRRIDNARNTINALGAKGDGE